MKKNAIIVLIYGLLILMGGIMGYVKAASAASLMMGAVFGILLIGASIALFKGKVFWGYFALVLGVILDAFFTYRFMNSLKFMPSGMMSLISLVFIIALSILLKKGLPQKKRR